MFKKLKSLFGPSAEKVGSAPSSSNEHAVLVYFDYAREELDDLHDLEEQLREAVGEAGVGEHDGHEIAMDGSHGTLFLYGPDADKLLSVVRPILLAAPCLENARAVLRYGSADDANAKQLEVDLSKP